MHGGGCRGNGSRSSAAGSDSSGPGPGVSHPNPHTRRWGQAGIRERTPAHQRRLRRRPRRACRGGGDSGGRDSGGCDSGGRDSGGCGSGGRGSGGRTLVLCDALINVGPSPPLLGWLPRTIIRALGWADGLCPERMWYGWQKSLTRLDDRGMRGEYDRLLAAGPWEAVVFGHGDVIRERGHAAVAAAIAKHLVPKA